MTEAPHPLSLFLGVALGVPMLAMGLVVGLFITWVIMSAIAWVIGFVRAVCGYGD